jgi:hypothetical protein
LFNTRFLSRLAVFDTNEQKGANFSSELVCCALCTSAFPDQFGLLGCNLVSFGDISEQHGLSAQLDACFYSAYFSTLKMGAKRSSETSESLRTTWRYNPVVKAVRTSNHTCRIYEFGKIIFELYVNIRITRAASLKVKLPCD